MSVDVLAPVEGRFAEVLTGEALEFVGDLQRTFDGRRRELLRARAQRHRQWNAGELPSFLPKTLEVREGDWQVSPPPPALQDRRVEITGPTDRKMVINALNSGARGFMADFEDSLSPTWSNVIGGQVNLTDAIEGTIEFEGDDGRSYELDDDPATLLVRPRGWHLVDRHIAVDGSPVGGAFLDFGLYVFRNARRLLERGAGPYFYLPKMESHLEARMWNEVFLHAQEKLGLEPGTIRATVLIETVPAAFEMDEILYELRDHSAGLNAGRWDYIFSMIKCFRDRPEFLLPDRADVTMTVPFMRAYTELLVKTCHRRGAHAMGGMAAFVPSRKKPEINEKAIAGVRADKEREAGQGFDGTWVAHPDLVEVATEEFDKVLGDRPNQVERQRDDVDVSAHDLLDVSNAGGAITEAGLRNDVNVGIQYISSWLRGNGAAAINNLMEDAATAEIARSQVWQWVRHSAELEDGTRVDPELVRRLEAEELEKIRAEVGDEFFHSQGRPEESRELFEDVALAERFIEFLTLPAYEQLED
ncbi:MAG: malate synthase [Thermoleophilaceae bacterium]|nr:malate synthase [Thermoleophilaceae bacterium]